MLDNLCIAGSKVMKKIIAYLIILTFVIYTYWSQRSQKDRDKYGIQSFKVGYRPWPKEEE